MKQILYIIVILLFFNNLKAQIQPSYTANPPVLVCVKNESSKQISIQWNASTNPGACFKEYGVYISLNDKSGPYTKVSSITNPADGTLTFDPQSGGVVYVFLINEQSCPNGNTQILTSDTLDNIVPQVAPTIIKITVENEVPIIYWKPSANPEVTKYAIFSIENNYNQAIDTVNGRTASSYQKPNHNPADSSAVFRIRSIEYCEDPQGLYSNITNEYNTIRLTNGEEDICKRSVQLKWNSYNNHGQSLSGYRIEYSMDNGNTYLAKDIVATDVLQYEFMDLTPQEVTFIRIVALLPGGESSLSNVVMILSKGIAPMEHHYIRNITVHEDHVELEYIPDPSAEISEIALERSTTGEQYTVLGSAVSINQASPSEPYIIKDFSALTDRTALYYQVGVKNACSNKYTTLPAKTIFLKGENLGLNNQVSWDEALVDADEILGYELFRIFEDETTLLYSSGSSAEYTDAGVFSNNFFAELCYFIRTEHRTSDPLRPSDIYLSQSNTLCLEPTPQAFVPNAFAPNGHNKIFKPILVFGTDIGYSLTIFDRNGKNVFESNQPNIGWSGTMNGKNSPLDSYVYHLQFTGLNGQLYKKTGFVVLVQ